MSLPSFIALAQAILGATLLYVALFLDEREERQLDERLATWWINVDDAATAALSWHTKLFRAAADRLLQLISFLFGSRILTLQAFWTAMFFNGAALALLGGPETLSQGTLPEIPPKLLGLICIVTGVLPAFGSERVPLLTGYVILLATWLSRLALAKPVLHLGDVSNRVLLGVSIASLLVGAALYVAVVGILRALFEHASRSRRWKAHILMIAGEIAVVLALFSGGALMMGVTPLLGESFAGYTAICLSEQFVYAGVAATCLVFLHVLFLLLLPIHQMFWPVLRRPLYAAHRHKLVSNHKLLAIAGTLLIIASGFPLLAKIVTGILQPLGIR